MGQSRSSSYESLTFGFMVLAFAVSLLIAWLLADWWLFIPIMLILAGGFWTVMGLAMRPPADTRGSSLGTKSYFVFWGATLVLLGAIWFLNDAYPGNTPAWVALILIWVGVVAVALALVRMRRQGQSA